MHYTDKPQVPGGGERKGYQDISAQIRYIYSIASQTKGPARSDSHVIGSTGEVAVPNTPTVSLSLLSNAL